MSKLVSVLYNQNTTGQQCKQNKDVNIFFFMKTVTLAIR